VTGRRIGAVLVAVALIAGALVVRRVVLDDDEDVAPTGSTSTTTAAAAAAGELICITELQAVCAAVRADHPTLTVTVQDAGATLDALAALPDDAPRPVWLTVQPFPAMVDSLRTGSRLTPFGGTAEPVASSRLAIATPPGRAEALSASCAGEPLWRCIGYAAGNPWTDIGGEAGWGRVRPSLGAVDRQAVALASFAAAVGGYFGRPDIRSSDWQGDPAFTPWLNQLAGAVDVTALSGGTPLATMVNRPSALDIAATTDAEVAAVGGDRFAVNYPEPSMWVEAVLAVPDGTAVPEGLVPALATAASAAGWDAPGAATQPLPGATTMLALRARWQETV
jgi:hypothetical protein